jgi:hypothetical protein
MQVVRMDRDGRSVHSSGGRLLAESGETRTVEDSGCVPDGCVVNRAHGYTEIHWAGGERVG